VTVAAALPAARASADSIVLWTMEPARSRDRAVLVVGTECDPWHMLAGASQVITSAQDELCLMAAILDVPVQLFDAANGVLLPLDLDPATLLAEALSGQHQDPFTGEAMSAREAIDLCGFWRRLIDSNRDIAGGIGFAFWKHDHVAPLLWSGGRPFQFLRGARDVKPGTSVALWRSKAPVDELSALEEAHVPCVEVEDGFLRSKGLGADCVPPLSITVDRLGAYFDPAQPSELEHLLQESQFDDELLARAQRLRRLIVEEGLGKYERGGSEALERPAGKRRHILVPGQVEDDRAVQTGGCGLVTNLDLLARVRAEAPGAYIIYKPHPDVVAGHRRGAIPNRLCLDHADQIVDRVAISSLIGMVDEVHVNTSLAGFEALLREKPVVTYGVPFYAGWGLTRDLGPVPSRRSARRTLDELVAAALLIYPRYFDPVTGLPCPAEVVVERLTRGREGEDGLVVRLRRIQGRVMRGLRSLIQ
jgi:capsular polysaccharide export protein